MKIDPRIPSANETQSSAVQGTQTGAVRPGSASGTSGAADGAGEDTVQLSSRAAEAQSLSAQIAGVPDIRAARVAPLQRNVANGTYQPDSGKVADAILSQQFGLTAA